MADAIAAQRRVEVADHPAMDPSSAIDSSESPDIPLRCPHCGASLDVAAVRRGTCPKCQDDCALGELAIADAVAIHAARAWIAPQIAVLTQQREKIDKSNVHPSPTVQAALRFRRMRRPPRLKLETQHGWCAALRAPLIADAASLRAQRLHHALIEWSVTRVHAQHMFELPWIRRGARALSVFVGAYFLIFEEFNPTGPWGPIIVYTLAAALFLAWAPEHHLATLRDLVRPSAHREILRERLVEAGLDVRPGQSRLHLQGWLMERWAAPFEGRELCRGESPQIITGGADALDAPMEGLVYLRRAADAVTVVLYLPTIDPRGALAAPSTARRADARRSLDALRGRGWSIDDSSGAGFLARREVREDEDLSPGTWRGIAADVAALLEVPAGLGLLSSRVALAQLRTSA